jgi:hypothetical protein
LEAQGGVVLTPDAFTAAPNLEFMVAWVAGMLDPSHPDVVGARDLLEAGAYFETLMAARRAPSG